MDDLACREFFTQPTQTFHRQYEALRAVFVEQQSQKDVAEQFGDSSGTLRQMVHGFRRDVVERTDASMSPFFATPPAAAMTTKMTTQPWSPTGAN